jgi:CheY-like chemotaxis protein
MDYNFIGKTILVVEDEEINRYFFEKALKKTQANLFFVSNGQEAIEMVKENTEIDLVLMDVRMNGIDGIETMSKIKQHIPELPVIIQTAYALPSVHQEAVQNGCDEFITKPIDIDILLIILKKHLF